MDSGEPSEGVQGPALGLWWRSPLLAGPGGGDRGATLGPHVGEHFCRWLERWWMENEDGGEWSYSTRPTSSTMDMQWVRFGEANYFRDSQSWQPRVLEVDQSISSCRPAGSSGSDTRFRLAS